MKLPSKTKEIKDAPFYCQSCGLGLKSEKTFKDHMKLKHPEQYTNDLIIFHCNACEEGFHKFKAFVLHTFAEHGEAGISVLKQKYPGKMKYACKYCAQVTFSNETMYQKHLRRCKLKQELGLMHKPSEKIYEKIQRISKKKPFTGKYKELLEDDFDFNDKINTFDEKIKTKKRVSIGKSNLYFKILPLDGAQLKIS